MKRSPASNRSSSKGSPAGIFVFLLLMTGLGAYLWMSNREPLPSEGDAVETVIEPLIDEDARPVPPADTEAAPAVPHMEIIGFSPWELEGEVAHTLHVRPGTGESSAPGNGSEQNPFTRIQAAVEQAFQTGTAAEGVRILIQPGTYRETVDIVNWNRTAPLVLEGVNSEDAEVILSGSDLFTAWEPVPGSPGVFQHNWHLNFGVEPNPWPGLMPLKDGAGFRRELFFVDGKPLEQAFKKTDLREGTYLVDEEDEKVYWRPAAGVNPASARVEISVRPEPRFGAHSKMIRVIGSRNIVLRNLVAQHAATVPFNSGAMQFLGTQNLLVEDCEVRWNNGVGFTLGHHQNTPPRNVTIRRLLANDNGTMGMEGSMHNALVEDSETNRNNWRGKALGATGWAPCGFKFSGIHGVLIRNHTANGNHASGGWLDDHITHVTLENFTALNNYRSGISIEAADGPVRVRGATFIGNSTGVNLFDSVNVHIDQSLILNNQTRGIRIAGSTPLSEEELQAFKEDWRRARLRSRRSPRDITVTRSIIGSTDTAQGDFLIEFGMREQAYILPDGTETLAVTLETLRLAGNTYALPGGPDQPGFRDARNRPIPLAAWQKLTGQDLDADWNPNAVEQAFNRAAARFELQPTATPTPSTAAPSANVDELEL
ncbi:MAG: right-handed parallel beta-helix repeat-containing protein [Verrucomicrobia bacterium]|nr:right-handed parallel beta-helix repeat-containing protein [Verrucomicrobiota bacterium]MCH8527285.1 right-handed parallel beta-helix repeat-containing protein [Kiritimatiellia bacterium]